MGGLSMTLTLQSRIEEETRKIIKALNDVDASGQKAQEAIKLISTAASGIQGAESINNLKKAARELGPPTSTPRHHLLPKR